MKTIILGAGFSGMAAGIKTKAPIYESTKQSGGICKTYIKEGFEFDQGGPHWLFGQNDAIEYIKTLVPLNSYERNAGVYYNTILPYPIQTFFRQREISSEGSFKEWLEENFSLPECNMFFNPFNKKYTANMYNEIIPYDAYKTPPAGSPGFVSVFHNPVGGLNTLVDKMASQCDIHYGKRAVQINYISKKVRFQDGEEVRYDRLISTIPLNNALALCGRQDFTLPYSSVLVINIGAEPDVMFPQQHWLYVPFCKSGFHRLGFYTNVEPAKAPEGKVSISVEMAFPPGLDFDDIDVEGATKDIVNELIAWRFIKNVVVTDPTWVKTAYTWMETLEERERHIQWLKERDIICVGRYATWKFQGLCESIQQGLGVEC